MSQYLEPNETALEKIKHIVVLMLENRSFDNLLGWLYDAETPPRGQEFNGLHAGLWNPLDNIDSDGIPFIEQVYIQKNGAPPQNKYSKEPSAPDYTLPKPDPGEGYKDTNHQLFQFYDVPLEYPPHPTNLGFVNNYKNAMLYGTLTYGDAPTDPRKIMTCYTPEQTPVLSTLAKQFAVCDEWFCSIPSQTLPNRDFVHAATSGGHVNNQPVANCDAPTIYNKIQDAVKNQNRTDLSWKVYSGTSKGQPFSLTRLIMTELHSSDLDANFVSINEFYKDASDGNLPGYSFLEPQFSNPGQNDQHPPSDIRAGEQLIADVYNAVVNSPNWEETLLVITYDEHGGCYDHVAPPGHATPPDKIGTPGQYGFTFNRFGVRVPAVLISPYIQAGTICRPAGYTPFDHTSILATVRNCFKLDAPLTARDAAAPDLSCVLALETPRTDKPIVSPLPFSAQKQKTHVNELHKTIARVLTNLTGKQHAEGENIHDFIHKTYKDYFYRRKTDQSHR
ncbi:MAG TPA: alkaline phosphatase family protein [Pyrinomonadaceae bacterium]|nr:alkaline phosphatase family protein [Pyrinomonadaceae bacterium]